MKSRKAREPKFIFTEWECLVVFTGRQTALLVKKAVEDDFNSFSLRLRTNRHDHPGLSPTTYALDARFRIYEGGRPNDYTHVLPGVRAFMRGFVAGMASVRQHGERLGDKK